MPGRGKLEKKRPRVVKVPPAEWSLPATISVNQSGSVGLRQYASNDDGWTISVSGLPAGVTYDSGTESLVGAATGTDSSTATFTLSKAGASDVVDTATVALIASGADLNTRWAFQETPEFLNIKPAGTGTPAIPSNHPLFRAYPGIPYEYRAAVIGGVFPYTFALSGQPSGMTVDAWTGKITWSNPTSGTHGPITLTVTDNVGTETTTTWTLNVSTTGFYFCDANALVNGDGSLASPWNTLSSVVNGTSPGDITYFREGTYPLYVNSGSAELLISGCSYYWRRYPGDGEPIFDGELTKRINGPAVYFDNITLINGLQRCLSAFGSDYMGIWRCKFDGLDNNDALNLNQGMISTGQPTPIENDNERYGYVVQDSTFLNFYGGQALGSNYAMEKLLFEDNYFDSGTGTPTVAATFREAIGIKQDCLLITIRRNHIIPRADANKVELFNAVPPGVTGEFSFNFVDLRYVGKAVECGYAQDTTFIRNTLTGNINFRTHLGTGSTGPYFLYENVRVDSINTYVADAPTLTETNSLSGVTADNIIDSSGLLTPAYSEWVGKRGWQIGGR